MEYQSVFIFSAIIIFGVAVTVIVSKPVGLIITLISTVLFLTYYYYYNFSGADEMSLSKHWPPRWLLRVNECPDYFSKQNEDDKKVYCKYDVKLDDSELPSACNVDGTTKTIAFPKIKKLPISKDDSDEIRNWLDNCKLPYVNPNSDDSAEQSDNGYQRPSWYAIEKYLK